MRHRSQNYLAAREKLKKRGKNMEEQKQQDENTTFDKKILVKKANGRTF